MVRGQGGTMVSLQPCHLTQPSECQALVDLAVRAYGRIDVLFNNAAMAYFNWLEDITDEEWNRDLREEVNLVFFLTRAAWPHLKASHGVVVNTASLNALLSFKRLPSLAHTASKAAVIGMTRQFAMEGHEHGIRANSISPGLIETNQTREQLQDPEWAASLLLVAGNLGDKFGRRGALLVGLVIFGAGSGLAAFASSATVLIAFRALMGAAGAAIFPTTLSIITNIFEGDERGRAIGIWSAI